MWTGRETGEFLAFGSSLDLGQARRLADRISPMLLVIRMSEEQVDELHAASPDYYVIDTGELRSSLETKSEWMTIGDVVRDRFTPAIVLDTDDGWITAPADLDTRQTLDAVVLDDDGIVSKVLRGLRPLLDEDASLREREAPTSFYRHLRQFWNRGISVGQARPATTTGTWAASAGTLASWRTSGRMTSRRSSVRKGPRTSSYGP